MSTKSSIIFIEKRSLLIHLYKEMIDGQYYLEDENGRVRIPGEIVYDLKQALIKIEARSK